MKTAGGIIAIIAGIFGVMAAIFTLLIGGLGEAFEADGSGMISMLGWGGLLFAFLTIVLGAVALGTRSRWNGGLIISASLIGALLGGTFVAITMLLALIGGILVLAGSGKQISTDVASDMFQPASSETEPLELPNASTPSIASIYTERGRTHGRWKPILVAGGLLVGSLLVVTIGIAVKSPSGDQIASIDASPSTRLVATEVGTPAKDASPSIQSVATEIGTPARVGDIEFTLLGSEIKDSVGSGFIIQQARPGEMFLAIRYTYKNASNQPISTWSAPRIRLVDGNGQTYSQDIGASSSYAVEVDIDSNAFSDINPGVTQTDADVFVLSSDHFLSNTWMIEVTQAGIDRFFILEEKAAEATATVDVGHERNFGGDLSDPEPATADQTSQRSDDVEGSGSGDGYSMSDLVEPPVAAEAVASVKVVNVESWDSLNVRSEPSQDSEILGILPPATEGVELLQCIGSVSATEWLSSAEDGAKPKGVWCEVYHDFPGASVRGWVNAWYLEP